MIRILEWQIRQVSYQITCSVLEWGSRGREFESRHSDHKVRHGRNPVTDFFCIFDKEAAPQNPGKTAR